MIFIRWVSSGKTEGQTELPPLTAIPVNLGHGETWEVPRDKRGYRGPEEMWLVQDHPVGHQTRSSVSQASAFHQATCSLWERVKPLKKKKNLSSKKSRDSPILFTWLEFPWYSYLCSVSGWWSQAGAQSTSFPATTQPKGHIGQQTAAQNGRQQSQLASRSRRRKLLVVVTMY